MEQGLKAGWRKGSEAVPVPRTGPSRKVIYEELVVGQWCRLQLRTGHHGAVDRAAEAIILGCTEIMLLVGDQDSAVPLFDTTTLHAQSAVRQALRDGG